jgi:hypothetical protein
MMVLDEAAAARLAGPGTIDGMAPAEGWEQHWREAVARRRAAAPWNPPALAAE